VQRVAFPALNVPTSQGTVASFVGHLLPAGHGSHRAFPKIIGRNLKTFKNLGKQNTQRDNKFLVRLQALDLKA